MLPVKFFLHGDFLSVIPTPILLALVSLMLHLYTMQQTDVDEIFSKKRPRHRWDYWNKMTVEKTINNVCQYVA